ncbi:hypothetical protein BDV18DRAFT_163929 [Aspergillus unguis]
MPSQDESNMQLVLYHRPNAVIDRLPSRMCSVWDRFKPEKNVSHLPRELQLMIFKHIREPDPAELDFVFETTPAALCLVNREYNRIFTPALYSHFHYDGNPRNVHRLWCFLRTIYHRPDLAAHVRGLVLVTTKTYDPYATVFQDRRPFRQALVDMAFDNWIWYRKALKSACLDNLIESVKMALFVTHEAFIHTFDAEGRPRSTDSNTWHPTLAVWEDYQSPLTSVILAHCPNARKIHLHVKGRDILIENLLQHATGQAMQGEEWRETGRWKKKLAFQNVESLAVGPALSSRVEQNVAIHEFEYPWHYLPRLKEFIGISAFIDLEQMAPDFDDPVSRIEKLTIVPYQSLQDLGVLASITTKLRHLTLSIPDGPRHFAGFVTVGEVWRALHPLREQLEFLDVTQNVGRNVADDRRWYGNRYICTSLSEFTKLRVLCAPIFTLTWYTCDHAHPERLKAHLPPNLESLGLYTTLAGVMRDDHAFSQCLEDELDGICTWALWNCKVKTVYFDGRQTDALPLGRFLSSVQEHKPSISIRHGMKYFVNGGVGTVAAGFAFRRAPIHAAKRMVKGKAIREVIPKGMTVHDYEGVLE